MTRILAILLVALLPLRAAAAEGDLVRAAVEDQILPGFAALAEQAAALDAAAADCAPDAPALRAAWNATFDAWLAVSHFRFGPTEVENRAFALAFWPDPRGSTAKALRQMIASRDAAVESAETFATVSVAARGLYALEQLLYDPETGAADPDYACALTRAIAHDIAATSAAMRDDWEVRYAGLMLEPGSGGSPYATEDEALQELFKALSGGLKFNSDLRLGRPLGTFDRPRPNRAEARLSERSLRNVRLSVAAMEPLALLLADGRPEIAAELMEKFARVAERAEALAGDPAFAGVAEPASRLRIETLQQRIDRIREVLQLRLGPALGVAEGFNAMDGD